MDSNIDDKCWPWFQTEWSFQIKWVRLEGLISDKVFDKIFLFVWLGLKARS